MLREFGDVEYIYHLAADTHVDRSIADPKKTVSNNVGATLGALDLARRCGSALKSFLHFSTDEVYGPCPKDLEPYRETHMLRPTNPYSASKAACEMIVESNMRTFGIPVKTIRSMNALGVSQDWEKFLPKLVASAFAGETVGLHVDANGEWGSRGYLSAEDASRAAVLVAECGENGQVYNVPCSEEIDNLQLLRLAEDALGIEIHHKSVVFDEKRPGHDMRYALDGEKIRSLGWSHLHSDMQSYVKRCSRLIAASAELEEKVSA